MRLKVGQSLSSSIDATTVVVLRAPEADLDLRCGGVAMYDASSEQPTKGSATPDLLSGTQLGKRYVDRADTIELLCTKGGEGALALGDEVLGLKQAKTLPSSD